LDRVLDPLIWTKLRVPQVRPKLVARPDLTERLNPESGRKLTLITAPAGFGKTTLLGEWVATCSDERSIAWVSVDEADNDLARFLSYLVAALGTIEEGFGEGNLSSLRARQDRRRLRR
jgi:LuxR family transcriptional regulator, maltose regulon positive regulatory protein